MTPNILDPLVKNDEPHQNKESIVRSRMKENINDVKSLKEICNSEASSESNLNKPLETLTLQEKKVFKPQIRWPDLIAQVFIHVGFLYGIYYLITLKAKLYTYVWCKSI